ncbi:MAG: hypothetical protein FWF49_02450, partial [Oscillospiraceae bacterium]|nr:hypothetical protein [Oscillospiraceae bacterium]
MRIDTLTWRGFRNLAEGGIKADAGVNILYGDNAQGKTNVLEALWLFTGARSFRGATDGEMVCLGGGDAHVTDNASLRLTFEAQGRAQAAAMTIEGQGRGIHRHAEKNGVTLPHPSALAGEIPMVVFAPGHLRLIKDGGDERRRWLDAACGIDRPAAIDVLRRHARLLRQRNALLKSGNTGGCGRYGAYGVCDTPGETAYAGTESSDTPDNTTTRDAPVAGDAWDVYTEQLAAAGEELTALRRAYVERLQKEAPALYADMAGGEQLTIRYEPSYEGRLLDALRAHETADRAARCTTVGAHRDDVALEIDGKPARRYASQGQQRTAALALKLGEARLLEQSTGERPAA